jgi:predicted O-linked N-acetylglucosamine transferase (SPINDLY family)
VAASLNHHLGLQELNVPDDDAFIETAIRMGQDRAARDELHERLAERRHASGLFDMPAFAADFVQLLERMADRHRQGLPPMALT